MTDYALLNIRTLPDPQTDPSALEGIPKWRCEYILRYLNAEDRKRSLGAWKIMQKMLSRYGFSADDVTLGDNGKLTCKGIYFNLSHSQDFALCAISDSPVGCDIEQVIKAPLDVAKKVFTLKEREYLNAAQGDEEKGKRFFKLWTIKEGYLKMTGEGLGFPMDRLEVDISAEAIFRDGVLQPCKIQSFSLDGYQISVLTESSF